MGRFLSVDPINSAVAKLPQSWNKYAYGANSPLKYIDPNGMEWFAVLQADSGGHLRHEAIVDINMKTGVYGTTYEHPRYEDEYIGPYADSYGPKRGLTAVGFKFLGHDFDPTRHSDPNPNQLYLDGTLQCTMYSEIKQGGRPTLSIWDRILISTGVIREEDVYYHPILADRKHDSSYRPRPVPPLRAAPVGFGDPHAFQGAIIDGVWISYGPPLLYY